MESLTSKEPDKDQLFAYLCKDTVRKKYIVPPPCQLRTDRCSQTHLETEFLTSYLEKIRRRLQTLLESPDRLMPKFMI